MSKPEHIPTDADGPNPRDWDAPYAPTPLTTRYALLLGPLTADAQVVFSDDLDVRSADVDGDGDPDLYVSRFAPTGGNALYLNEGGTSTTVDAGPLTVGHGSIGRAWADVDNDGELGVVTTESTGRFGNTGAGTVLYLNDGPDGDGLAFRGTGPSPGPTSTSSAASASSATTAPRLA